MGLAHPIRVVLLNDIRDYLGRVLARKGQQGSALEWNPGVPGERMRTTDVKFDARRRYLNSIMFSDLQLCHPKRVDHPQNCLSCDEKLHREQIYP